MRSMALGAIFLLLAGVSFLLLDLYA